MILSCHSCSVYVCFKSVYLVTSFFIVLIHPMQWTIALPVGVTGPTKCQKKRSCIYYRQDRSLSVHSLGGTSYFLSRQCDVIASFLFGAWSVQTCFQQRNIFEVLQRTLPFYFISSSIY